MDEQSRIEEKIDFIARDVAEIKKQVSINTITLAVNTESLKHHIKRTDLLEARTDSKFESIWPKVLMVLSILSAIAVLGKHLFN